MAKTYRLKPHKVQAMRYDKSNPSPIYDFLGLPEDCEELSRKNAEDCKNRYSYVTGYGFGDYTIPAILRWYGEKRGFTLLIKGGGVDHTLKNGMWLVNDGRWSVMDDEDFNRKYEED